MDAELVNAGRFAGSWYTADAHTDAIAAIGQTLVDNLLSFLLMLRMDTLYQRHRLRQNGDVALDDALHHFGNRQLVATEAVALQIGVDDRGLLYATVDLQSCIFVTILRMFHIFSKL